MLCIWSQKPPETVLEVVNFKIFQGGGGGEHAPKPLSLCMLLHTRIPPPPYKKSCINPCIPISYHSGCMWLGQYSCCSCAMSFAMHISYVGSNVRTHNIIDGCYGCVVYYNLITRFVSYCYRDNHICQAIEASLPLYQLIVTGYCQPR